MGELVPILAIIFIFGGGIIRRVLSMMERRMEMRISAQDQNLVQEMSALRRELSELRDTSTQFDMSLQNRLDELDRRMAHAEGRSRPVRAPEAVAGAAPPQDAASTPSTLPIAPSAEVGQQAIGLPGG